MCSRIDDVQALNKRMDPDKAVAAYSRSDAGAGHGDSAILPSDLRTPSTLMVSFRHFC